MTNTFDPARAGGGSNPSADDDELTPEERAELEEQGGGDDEDELRVRPNDLPEEAARRRGPRGGSATPARRFDLTSEEEDEISRTVEVLKRQADEEAAIRKEAIDQVAEQRREFLRKKKEDDRKRKVADEAADYAALFGLEVDDDGEITGLSDDHEEPQISLRGRGGDRRVPNDINGDSAGDVIDHTNETASQPTRVTPGGNAGDNSGSSGGGRLLRGFFGS